jgi:hypothetical protein
MELVLQQLFDKDTKINHRKENRLGDTVKWMKNLSLHLTEKGEDKSDIPEKINNLAQVLHHSTKPNQHILVYTDGSTETRKRKSKNSGYGVYQFSWVVEQSAQMAIILLQKWQLQLW